MLSVLWYRFSIINLPFPPFIRLFHFGFKSHRCHCVVPLSKNINPSLVLIQPRKTRPFITEILLMGRKVPNQRKRKHALLSDVGIKLCVKHVERPVSVSCL